MTTSSEDVLLSVGHVRYKKGDGTLYVMNQRLAWMVEHRDTVVVSHKYADIKTQKISPVGKPKVQLQVVLHDGTCSTFHFVNPAGAEAQADDRDLVKNQLQNLLPQFRRQVNRELEEKSRLLSLHPTLKHLYEDLVITKVISSEEYWNTPTIKQYTESQSEKQEVGVSGAFLADIKPQTDGCNGLKYNLTQDIIDAVFKTYPAVHKKHTDHVPNKMTESEFWTKFFQSHYFHRDRIITVSKDLFTECGRIDDVQLGKAIANGPGDPLLEIARWAEPDPLQDEIPSSSLSDNSSVPRSMIKRFNQHSIMVLKAGENSISNQMNQLDSKTDKKPEMNGGTNTTPKKNKAEEDNRLSPPSKKQRILEKISYYDLKGEEDDQVFPQLELSKVERYLHGPTNIDPSDAINPAGQRSTARTVRSLLLSWVSGLGTTRPLQPSAPAAVGALGELSPGGALMRHHHTHSLAQLVPADVELEVRRLYLGGGELLRAFWNCFQPTRNAVPEADKIIRAHEAIQRFKLARLKPFEDRMVRELSPLSHTLTKHLTQLLHSATGKFSLWQSRQAKIR